MINRGKNQVEVLGLSTYSVLQHTAAIFEDGEPTREENAVIELAESISEIPVFEKELLQYAADSFKLSAAEVKDLFTHSEVIGFFDIEGNKSGERLA